MAIWRPSEAFNRMGDPGNHAYFMHFRNMAWNALHERMTAAKYGVQESGEIQALRVAKTRRMFGGLLGSIDAERLDKENATLG